MQQSAVPELAHTHTRPIHWLATATALAGVVAASAFLQPDRATAAQPGPEAKTVPAAVAPPDPSGVDFPIECGPTKAVVQKQTSGDLDGDGRPETAAVVHCDAGSGTPPSGIYVLTQGEDDSKPRVVATLIDPKDRLTVKDFTLRDATITATLLGYSSPDVPSCCPDVNEGAKWQWKNGSFIRSAPSGARGA